MTRTSDTNLCPYCARPYSDGGGRTAEHVFGEAFGSRFVIGACTEFNNQLGTELEGDIHASDSVVGIIKWAAGKSVLRGTADVGGLAAADVIVDGQGRPSLAHPTVEFERTGDKLEGNLVFPEGTTPDQIAAVIEKRLQREGMSPETAKEAATMAVVGARLASESVQVQARAVGDLGILQRHAAKVALAASVVAGVAIVSKFAQALRDKLHSSDGLPEQSADPQTVERVREEVAVQGL